MSIESNKKLCAIYPFLRDRKDEFDFSYTLLDEVPQGWRDLFLQMCWRIRDFLIEKNEPLEKFEIYQIKEKYGELRVYSNILFEEINEIIEDYCKRSKKICIRCGNHLSDEETKVIDDLPLCKECIGGLKYVTH